MQIYAQLYCLNSLLLAEVCVQNWWSRVVNTPSCEHSFLSGFNLFGCRDFPRQSFEIKCWFATLDLGFEFASWKWTSELLGITYLIYGRCFILCTFLPACFDTCWVQCKPAGVKALTFPLQMPHTTPTATSSRWSSQPLWSALLLGCSSIHSSTSGLWCGVAGRINDPSSPVSLLSTVLSLLSCLVCPSSSFLTYLFWPAISCSLLCSF